MKKLDGIRIFNLCFAACSCLAILVKTIIQSVVAFSLTRLITNGGLMIAVWAFYILGFIFRYRFPKLINTVFLSHFFLAGVLGSAYGLMAEVFFFDDILHFIFGYVGAIAGLFLVCTFVDRKALSPFFICIFVFAASMTLAAIWEMWEFMADKVFGFNCQGIPNASGEVDVMDTMMDIVWNAAGAAIFVIHIIVSKLTRKNLLIDSFMKDFALNREEKQAAKIADGESISKE